MITTKHKTIFLLGLIISVLTSCNGQSKSSETLYLKDFQFDSHFGIRNNDESTNYCLLGQGFFRTPSAPNSDSLLSIWLEKHPNSIVVLVSSFKTYDKNIPNHKMAYCWIIDGMDTLNNYLIKQGCYPGGTMQRPQTWQEMSREEKSFYKGEEKPDVTVHVDNKTYHNFIEQIKSAELYARDNKLGIWSNSEK